MVVGHCVYMKEQQVEQTEVGSVSSGGRSITSRFKDPFKADVKAVVTVGEMSVVKDKLGLCTGT